jgi:hypothetical protein
MGLAESDRLAFDTDFGKKTPVEVSSEILRALAKRAEENADGRSRRRRYNRSCLL